MQSMATKEESFRSNTKNCINREAKLIDFILKAIAREDEYQVKEISEWIFTRIKPVNNREVEIIEAQGFSEEIEGLLKKEVQELVARRDSNIVFYTDESLGKGADEGIMGVGWLGIDSIENRVVSIGKFKVVN